MEPLTTEEFEKLLNAFKGYPHLQLLIGFFRKQNEPKKRNEADWFFVELQRLVMILDTDKILLDNARKLFKASELVITSKETNMSSYELTELIDLHLNPPDGKS